MLHLTPNLRSSVLVALALAVVAWMVGCRQEPTAMPTVNPLTPTPTPTTVASVTPTPTPTPWSRPTIINGGEGYSPCGPFHDPYDGEFHEHFLHWASDDSQLVFDQEETIWRVDIEGAMLGKVVDPNPGTGPFGPYKFRYGFYGDVSPDGSQIVYASCQYEDEDPSKWAGTGPRAHLGYEIAMINIDGTGQHRLTRNSHFDNYPAWSPDGTRIAFVVSRSMGGSYYRDLARLYLMSVDRSDPPRIVAIGAVGLKRIALYPPVWSPDGEFLTFMVYEGEYYPYRPALHTMRVGWGNWVRIGETTVLPTWSPDSERLAFAMSDEEGAAIYTVRPDGTDLRQVWSIGADGTHPPITQVSWSPDGSEILVVSGWLWAIRPDGSGFRVLGSSNPPIRLDRASWSSDGSRIAAYGAHGWAIPNMNWYLITMSRDGTDVRVLVRAEGEDDGRGIHAWNPPRPETPVDLTACSSGRVVPAPMENLGLVQDCEALLGMRDKLAGSGSLNWNADTSIRQWEGVVLDGSPLRVHGLNLGFNGLTGTLPPELDQLTELRWLDLAGGGDTEASVLTGAIPPELGNLTKLDFLLIGTNFLSGSVPPELGNLANLRTLELGPHFLSGCIPEGLSRLWVERTELERCTSAEATSP